MFALLAGVWNLLQNAHNITLATLGMLPHYLGKLKIQNFCRCGRNANKLHFNCLFVIHPQIWIFSVFKIASLSAYWFQIKISISLFCYLFTFAMNLWHRKFVIADVTAVLVNNKHGIQRRRQDFDKKFVFEGLHSKQVNRRISWEKVNKAWC